MAPTPSKNASSRSGSGAGSSAASCRPPPYPPPQAGEGNGMCLDFRGRLLGKDRRNLRLGSTDGIADAALLIGVGPAVAGLARDRAAQVTELVAQLVHHLMGLGAPLGAPALFHPAEDLVDLRPPFGHEGTAGIGDAVDLASVLLDGADVAHVLEHLQCRVDGAGARGIEAAGALLERLDQLVAMGGLVLELVEDDVLEVAPLEHLAAELVEAELTT